MSDLVAELIVKALETQHQGTHTPPAACPYVHDAEEAHYFLTEEHLAAQPDHHTSGQSSFWIPSVRITEGSDYLHGITGIDRLYVSDAVSYDNSSLILDWLLTLLVTLP